MMPKRKPKRDPSGGEADEKGEGEGVRSRSRTVMGLLKTKLRRKSAVGAAGEEGAELSYNQKCATLPARVTAGGKGGGRGKNEEGKRTRTLHWMEELLGPFEESLRTDGLRVRTVSRKDSDESVDSGFEQAQKMEGSETDSNSSPAQSKALLPVGSLCRDVSDSFHEEPRYQSVQANSMYDEAAFDKAFGPMKDVGRWYSTYSSQRQLLKSRNFDKGMERENLPVPQQKEEEEDERRPEVPARLSRCTLEEHEQRLISRPLPPIPCDAATPGTTDEESKHSKDGRTDTRVEKEEEGALEPVAMAIVGARRGRKSGHQSPEGMYELVEHRLRGTNPLTLGLRNVARYGWYWGPVTRVEAEEKLQGALDGTFLVRDSSDERYLLSLSFRSQGKSLHTRIEYSNGFFSFYSFPDSDTEGYRSVVELIEWSMKHSREGVFCFSRGKALGSPAVPVRLLKPLSRFNQVRSLQHYCRFVIRQSIRFDCIRQLPLPRHVHGYLEQSHY